MIRGLTSFVVGMIDHVAMLFNLFSAIISIVYLVLIVVPLGPDHVREWSALALPGGLYLGTLLIRVVCRKVQKLLYVSPYQPLKPLELTRHPGQ